MATTRTISQCSLCGTAASARLNRALTCSSCIGDRCVLHSMLDISKLTSCVCSLAHLRARLATVCAQRDALRSQAEAQLQLVVRLLLQECFCALARVARTVRMLTTPRQAETRRARDGSLASRLEFRLHDLRRSRELLAAELREGAHKTRRLKTAS